MATSFHYSDLVPSWAKASEILKGDVAGHEFHGNQYTEGQGSWKPVMSSDEARKWVKDTGGRYQGSFFHGTSTASADAIKEGGLHITESGSAGAGIYLTDETNVANKYAKEQQRLDTGLKEGTWEHADAQGEVLTVYTNAKNVADPEQSADIINRALKLPLNPSDRAEWSSKSAGELIRQQAVSEGFDGMMYKSPVYDEARGGSHYLVVFDPKNVVVVSDKIQKGDVAGHEFHGNQYTGGKGKATENEPLSKERLADLANLYIKVSRLNPATSVGRAVTDPFMIRKSCFEAELHARLSGEHIPSEWKVGSVINHADAEQRVQAIKDADDFMRAISDNSKVYPELQRGIFDKGGELTKQFVEGKTIDLPLASFSTDPDVASTYAQGGRGAMNIGDGNNHVVIYAFDAVGGTLAPYTNIPYWQGQVLTGGRFTVEKVETTKANFGGGNYVEVLLKQEAFVAKAIDTNWKVAHPNLFPTWFPNNFNPNMVIASVLSDSDEPIAKGDVSGHEFHGNQYTGGRGGGANGKSRVESNAQTLLKSLSLQKRLEKDFNGFAGELKSNICRDIAQRLGDKWDKQLGCTSTQEREEAVSKLVANWATTSNNSDPMSLAIQKSAAKEFGITSAKDWEVDGQTRAETDDILSEKGEMLQAFLRAQYDATQEYFKGAGIKEVTLYRGFDDEANYFSDVAEGSSTEVPLRPISSFTSNYDVATRFGNTIISGTIPVERVLSCYGTGVGCQEESEVVVFGGEGQWQVNGQMNLEGADLANADLTRANLTGANLTGADLSGANLSNANLPKANLLNANLSNANLRGAYLGGANLANADLTGAFLTRATLNSANLEGANLSSATLTNAYLLNANLTGANLTGANLTGAGLTKANLTGANLTGSYLYGTNLTGAHLNGANLTNADLTNANLTGAYLNSANLGGANLGGAKLWGAVLSGADLTNADLTVADLNNALLNGANGSDRTVLPESSQWKVDNNKIVSKAGATSLTKGETNEVEYDLGNATDWKVAWASPPTKVVTKGDVKGHEFHGNQYTGGLGGEANPLSDKEKEDLNTWSEIADGMGGPSRDALEKIALKANEKAPELFRGIQLEPQDYRELMTSLRVGATIKLPFSSWSENRMVGEQFASEDSPMGFMGEKGVVFHIAEGTRGVSIAPYAVEQFQYQKEWLIPERGFRVVSVTKNSPDAMPEQDPTFPDWAFENRRDFEHTLVELAPL